MKYDNYEAMNIYNRGKYGVYYWIAGVFILALLLTIIVELV